MLTLVPGTGGIFLKFALTVVLIWSRAEQARFPEIKELKRLECGTGLAPGRTRGHADR